MIKGDVITIVMMLDVNSQLKLNRFVELVKMDLENTQQTMKLFVLKMKVQTAYKETSMENAKCVNLVVTRQQTVFVKITKFKVMNNRKKKIQKVLNLQRLKAKK